MAEDGAGWWVAEIRDNCWDTVNEREAKLALSNEVSLCEPFLRMFHISRNGYYRLLLTPE